MIKTSSVSLYSNNKLVETYGATDKQAIDEIMKDNIKESQFRRLTHESHNTKEIIINNDELYQRLEKSIRNKDDSTGDEHGYLRQQIQYIR
jgi:hypothetical protein